MSSRTILFKKVFWCTLFVLWASLIIFFTTQNGSDSSEVSGFVAEKIWRVSNRLLNSVFGRDISFITFHFIVRKIAHFLIHFVFAFIAVRASAWNFPDRKFALIFAWGISLVVAVLDEAAQLSVPGRYGIAADAGINLAGTVLGALLSSFIGPKSSD